MDMKTEPSILVQGSRLDQSRHIGRKPVTLASLGVSFAVAGGSSARWFC